MTKNDPVVLILPGDGIGPEIMAETVRIANWFRAHAGVRMQLEERAAGGVAYRQEGSPLPSTTLSLAREAQAILLGSVGHPDLDYLERPLRPSYTLWFLRKDLDLCANLRPIRMRDELLDASTLRPEVVKGTDFIFVRELTEGLYYGEPRGKDSSTAPTARAFNTMYHTRGTVRKVAVAAFEMAKRRRGEVCSVDKSNVLEVGELWREEVIAVHRDLYPEIKLRHMYVDNAAMQIVRNPKQFDVVLTENLFGDILSDAAAMATGSIGTLPSAALAEISKSGKPVKGLYEPIHGSAPDIAGRGIANPIGCILSFAMLLEHSLGYKYEAEQLDRAVSVALSRGARTADMAGPRTRVLTTSQMGDAIIAALTDVYSSIAS